MNTAVVLGGSGFLGSHMVDLLLQMGLRVVNMDSNLSGRHKKIPQYIETRCEIDYFSFATDNVWQDIRPTYIFNFISTASIQECEDNPLAALDNNVITNAVILNSLKEVDFLFTYVYASSVYAGSDDLTFYGLTKRCCEQYIRRWFQINGGSYLILRYGTVYGPRASEDNSIRQVLSTALQEGVVSFYGSGDESREYIYVADAARYTYELAANPEYCGKTIKLTGSQSVKAKQLAQTIKELLGGGVKVEFRREERKGHYISTPYRYVKETPLNYSGDEHCDLGVGLLETIKDLAN